MFSKTMNLLITIWLIEFNSRDFVKIIILPINYVSNKLNTVILLAIIKSSNVDF